MFNMFKNANTAILYDDDVDFLVADTYPLEVGGKNKKVKNSRYYIAMDNMEKGFGNTMPLWLFGFLY